MRRPLRIVIVDDEEVYLKVLVKTLDDKRHLARHIPRTCIPLLDQPARPIKTHQVLEENPDLVFLDYTLASPQTGDILAAEIREKRRDLPIVLMSGIPQEDRYKPMMSAVTEDRVDTIFDKSPGDQNIPKKLENILLKHAKIPLTVSVIGLGMFGIGLLSQLRDASYIKYIKGFSERREQGKEADYSAIYKLLELSPDNQKIHLKESFEEAVDDTDCVVICTSARHGPSAEKIATRSDRLDLLSIEGPKIYNYCKRLARHFDDGAVLMFTNPVGANLELAVRAGLHPQKVTSPFYLDAMRIAEERAQRTEELSQLNSHSLNLLYCGEHGAGYFLLHQRPSPSSQEVFQLQEEAMEKGKQAMQAATLLGVSYTIPQKAATMFLEDLAHFKQKPSEAAYCQYTLKGIKGYLALPVKLSYAPFQCMVDNELLEDYDTKSITTAFSDYFKTCDQYVRSSCSKRIKKDRISIKHEMTIKTKR